MCLWAALTADLSGGEMAAAAAAATAAGANAVRRGVRRRVATYNVQGTCQLSCNTCGLGSIHPSALSQLLLHVFLLLLEDARSIPQGIRLGHLSQPNPQ